MIPEERADELVGQMLGRYRVLRQLGAGGMGVVYRAEDSQLGRAVALKVLPATWAADAERRARFLREARSAAAVSHPNVAAVFDIGEERGRAYIALELVEGSTLRSVLSAGRLSLDEALRIGEALAAGLARAHAVGVVHRDLKPENVILTADREPKILDFGLAKLLSSGGDDVSETTKTASVQWQTAEGRLLGTPGYLSPEQAAGDPVDARSDVFSFGVMLHEMLAGELPFRGASLAQLVASLLRDPPAPLPPEVPAEVARLVARCLQKDPASRPPTGQEVLEELRAIRETLRSVPPSSTRGLLPKGPAVLPATSVTTLSGREATLAPTARVSRGRRAARTAAVGALLLGAVGAGALGIWATQARNSRTGTSPSAGPAGSSGSASAPRKAQPESFGSRLLGNRATNAAALAPDGKSYAAVENDGVYTVAVDGSGRTLRPLSAVGEPISVTFYPAGDALLVSACAATRDCSLVRLDLGSGEQRIVRELGMLGSVSPNGRWLAYVDPVTYDLELVETTAGAVPRVLAAQVDSFGNRDCVPAWSPDSQRLVVVGAGDSVKGSESLTVIEVSGTTRAIWRSSLLVSSAGTTCPAFLPDGDVVVHLSEKAGPKSGTRLVRVPADGRPFDPQAPEQQLGFVPGLELMCVAFPAEGRHGIGLALDSKTAVEVGRLEEDGRHLVDPVRLSPGNANGRLGEWVDDKTVAYASDASGQMAIYLHELTASGPTLLWANAASLGTYPVRSPDGREVLFWNVAAPRTDELVAAELWTIPRTGGEARKLLATPAPIPAPRVGAPPPRAWRAACPRRPGAPCVWGLDDGGTLSLFSVQDGAASHPLGRRVRDGGGAAAVLSGWSLSPDGKRVAFVDGRRVRVFGLEGEAPDQEARVDGSMPQYPSWDAAGHAVFVSSGNELRRVVPGEPTIEVVYRSSEWVGPTSASPDGKHLALVSKNVLRFPVLLSLP